MPGPFKIAIVGAGLMATEHARAFASYPDARIVGLVGRSPERAQALADAHGCPLFPTIDAMHEATGADAVIVAVPELSCRDVCMQVFHHDWVSLLEKPVGVDLADAREILAACESMGREAYVALNRRSYSSTRAALELLEGDSSERLIVVSDAQDLREAARFNHPEPVIANWMYANSIHLVDYLRAFGRGEPARVEVSAPWIPDNPGPVVATVHFGSGDIGLYQAVWNAPGPWSVVVTNRSLRAEMRPLEQLGVQRLGERRLTPVETAQDDIDYKAGLRRQARMLLDGLAGGGNDLPTLADATESMALVARIYGLDGDHDGR